MWNFVKVKLRLFVYTVRMRMHTHGIAVAFPSVCQTREFWQNKIIYCQNSYINSSIFLTGRMVGGGRPLLPEIVEILKFWP